MIMIMISIDWFAINYTRIMISITRIDNSFISIMLFILKIVTCLLIAIANENVIRIQVRIMIIIAIGIIVNVIRRIAVIEIVDSIAMIVILCC